MELDIISNYIFTRKLNLNISEQLRAAHTMYKIVGTYFDTSQKNQSNDPLFITKLFAQYNYLLYPLPGIPKLYNAIKETFNECLNRESLGAPDFDEYQMQCWLNVYNRGEYIDWHSHWPSEYKSWHGFYCIDVEPDSFTSYNIPLSKTGIINVQSKNNLLVISRSGGDFHRSSEWKHDRPRITVAFDIVPTAVLSERMNKSFDNIDLNHWVPV